MERDRDDHGNGWDHLVNMTAWPTRREPERTMFRCRVWGRTGDSGPFYSWGSHRLLSEGGPAIIAVMVGERPDVREMLLAAVGQDITVEVNHEPLSGSDVSAAIGSLIPAFEPELALKRERRRHD